MPQPDLDDLRAFVAIANRRSFRKAADELGVAPSTLSHMMRVMEEKLGVRLLHRTTRSVAPTEAGEHFLRRIEPVLRELNATFEDVNGVGQQPGGLLRINTAEPTARWLLQHAVPVFEARYPAVALDLFVDNGLVDIVAGGFDAGVRLAEAVPQDMHMARFGAPVCFMPMASPAYLQAHGAPKVPDDLLGHRCIRMRMQSGKIYRWEFARHGQAFALDVPGTLVLNQVGLMVEAALAGQGIAYVPDTSARDHLAAGRLVPLLQDWCEPSTELALYYPGHRHVPAALRAFIAVLQEVFGPPSRQKPHARRGADDSA
ncbi:LysR family transcriptional regulator [Massilia aurea]|uniref:LysR family transcriptional regulator n=1 Tax=Massilia aurea TaxID=373040 RepID=UPI003462C6DB